MKKSAEQARQGARKVVLRKRLSKLYLGFLLQKGTEYAVFCVLFDARLLECPFFSLVCLAGLFFPKRHLSLLLWERHVVQATVKVLHNTQHKHGGLNDCTWNTASWTDLHARKALVPGYTNTGSSCLTGRSGLSLQIFLKCFMVQPFMWDVDCWPV